MAKGQTGSALWGDSFDNLANELLCWVVGAERVRTFRNHWFAPGGRKTETATSSFGYVVHYTLNYSRESNMSHRVDEK